MTAPALAELIERMTGLALHRGGVSKALDRFVADRMRALGLTMVESYVQIAADATRSEQRKLIDAITVPHTWFYRDPEQLRVIARLMVAAPAGPLSVWVAGCATGEEAYTLAMIARRVGREVRIHATDVNEHALAAARRGVYSALSVRDVPEYERHWVPQRENGFVVDDALRSSVRFERHNLVDAPPQSPRGWDLVVCRNVLIYFAPRPASQLLARFARAVREGGALVVGASEVVFEPPPGLELMSSDNRLVLRRPVRPSTPRVEARGTPPAPLPAPPAPPPPPDPDRELVAALGRGHVLFERAEIAAAIEVYDALARAHPSVAEVWMFLGIARYAHGEIDSAAAALRASLCLDAALWPAGFYLARAYERLGRRADALQQYDLIAVDDLPPLALKSTSAVINELRAFGHDFRNAARRLSAERTSSARRLR